MASKENQCALNNLVYFADPFDRDEFNRVERWKKTLQQAIDRLELVEKALEINCRDRAFCDIDQHSTQDFMDMYIAKARKELENGK